MRILFCGDIVGRSGREALHQHLPFLKKKLAPDLIIVNGENAAHGFGITRTICEELYTLGVHVITGGNHSWDKPEIGDHMEKMPHLLRPINYPPGTPGYGSSFFTLADGRRALVINAMGRLFMDPLDDPFYAVNEVLNANPMGRANLNAIIIDIHAEATSEKMALASYVDGYATLVVGSHTHIPTADAQILAGGTAYQTDAGMCGDYNSVIGMQKEGPIKRFTTKINRTRLMPAEGEGTLCGVFVESDDTTGLARSIYPIRLGPRLHESLPIYE